ncbi:hypothetical protein R3P38DRAFT_3186915 [Favolaschia claudopus]|uniref:F-box domain-containing protein n=1 Tax=Favolaschia claudopus TaxID=2862362 RepID=A0AAW0C3E6_9AGAR
MDSVGIEEFLAEEEEEGYLAEQLYSNNPQPTSFVLAHGLSILQLLATSAATTSEPNEFVSANHFLKLTTRLALLEGCFSPQRRLPPEMLGLIFTFCLDDDLTTEYTLSEEEHMLIVLGQVCSRWRAVVRIMIGFWTKLHFRTAAMKPCNAAVTQHLISLSRDMPLSLRFSSLIFDGDEEYIQRSNDSDGQASAMDLPSLSALECVVDRLEQLELDVTATDFRCSLVNRSDMEFCMLSTLSISVVDSRKCDFEDCLEIFRNAPVLRTLTIVGDEPPSVGEDGWPHMDTVWCSSFPWNQLTNLTIDIGIIAAEARKILCLCTALEVAVFSKLADDPAEEDARFGRVLYPDSTLPNLRELSITSDRMFCCDVLECMWLPNLESLTLEMFNCLDANPILRDLAQRSNFSLLRLRLCGLDGFDRTADVLHSFLTHISTLQELDLQYCSDLVGLMKSFTYPRSQGGLALLRFPHLRVFTVTQPDLGPDGECPKSFLRLVESLSHHAGGGGETPCPVLETIRIPFHADGGTRMKEQLASVCANGFNIEYLSSDPE